MTVTVDGDGVPRDFTMMRWGKPGGEDEFDLCPFGGSVDAVGIFGGVTIAVAGSAGWWGTDRQDDGELFRDRITDLRLTTDGMHRTPSA